MRASRIFFSPLFAVVSLTLLGTACDSQGDSTTGRRVRVPEEKPSIQAAVASARSGDLILVSPGTYNEKVFVDKPGITIRGLDRNTVILDGQYQFQNRHRGRR